MTSLTFERKDDYWANRRSGKRWRRVSLATTPPGLRQLLAGDVDVIETVPTADAARMAKDPRVTRQLDRFTKGDVFLVRLAQSWARRRTTATTTASRWRAILSSISACVRRSAARSTARR